ncbi:uncharacterized protein EHS24_002368 [Apiotrichum porosum]|uniref:Uncharacterized protein n=1 Tax=Apiotrichum porosum TaxID=105984 RepID=A0A427XIB1_9TREE|nr:uncharacterized protein EHS24_002368 [Apiotrichum porosum]RSH78639.1 hypothetical protein EHS24_002368 [Apiotrichum porosum]
MSASQQDSEPNKDRINVSVPLRPSHAPDIGGVLFLDSVDLAVQPSVDSSAATTTISQAAGQSATRPAEKTPPPNPEPTFATTYETIVNVAEEDRAGRAGPSAQEREIAALYESARPILAAFGALLPPITPQEAAIREEQKAERDKKEAAILQQFTGADSVGIQVKLPLRENGLAVLPDDSYDGDFLESLKYAWLPLPVWCIQDMMRFSDATHTLKLVPGDSGSFDDTSTLAIVRDGTIKWRLQTSNFADTEDLDGDTPRYYFLSLLERVEKWRVSKLGPAASD